MDTNKKEVKAAINEAQELMEEIAPGFKPGPAHVSTLLVALMLMISVEEDESGTPDKNN